MRFVDADKLLKEITEKLDSCRENAFSEYDHHDAVIAAGAFAEAEMFVRGIINKQESYSAKRLSELEHLREANRKRQAEYREKQKQAIQETSEAKNAVVVIEIDGEELLREVMNRLSKEV